MAQNTQTRYGRRAPKRARALALGPALSGAAFGGWQMLGIDVTGDCVAVTWPTSARSRRQSSADGDMDIQTALEYLQATGGPDGSMAVAFARVD